MTDFEVTEVGAVDAAYERGRRDMAREVIDKTIPDTPENWTLDQFVQHYVETMEKPPNAWGQHLSPIFGQSHHIMNAASRIYDIKDFMKSVGGYYETEAIYPNTAESSRRQPNG